MPTTSCTACGLPPLPNQRLLRCTRCHNAWYHDVACQKKDFKRHKAECLRIAANIRVSSSSSSPGASGGNTRKNSSDDCKAPKASTSKTPSFVECRTIEGKGRSLFATAALPKWSRPLENPCAPLVLPVLHEEVRAYRCAYCFRRMEACPPCPPKNVLHSHCDPSCEELNPFWQSEHLAAGRLIQTGQAKSLPGPTTLLCSRILRKIQSDENVKRELEQLCYCPEDMLSQDEKEICRSLMRHCSALLYHMGELLASKMALQMIEPDPTPAYRFVSRITMNGFTITTSESFPIGTGIFPMASMINHSCRPNAVQTFWFDEEDADPPSMPKLQITTCRSVKAGEEITISYCENSCPRKNRQNELWEGYKFHCNCDWCERSDVDAATVGLRCKTPGCVGEVVSMPQEQCKVIDPQNVTPKGLSSSETKQCKMICDTCGCTDFEEAFRSRTRLMDRIEKIGSSVAIDNADREEIQTFGEELYNCYEASKKLCHVGTSWYVAWAADSFVNWCANALPYCKDDSERMETCRKALTVIQESRDAMEFCMNYPGNLRWSSHHLGVEAKMRLFVNPMDRKGLMILKKARKEMLKFYPHSDAFVRAMEKSIEIYSFPC